MALSKEELKEYLTSDSATIMESLFCLIDDIYDLGYVDIHRIERQIEEKIDKNGIPSIYVWSIDDVKFHFKANNEEASEVIDLLQDNNYASDCITATIMDMGEDLKLEYHEE